MQLTLYTDYSLRVLIHLSLQDDKPLTINEIAEFYKISRNHLVKVVHNLAQKGFIHTTRGKGGGIRLARPADTISVGEVVRQTEPNFHIVECFNAAAAPCAALPVCKLKAILGEATDSFLSVLDGYTIADLLENREQVVSLFGIDPTQAVKLTY